jgi:hypothetical protein
LKSYFDAMRTEVRKEVSRFPPPDAEMNQMVDDLRMQFLNAFGKEEYYNAGPE